MRYVYLKLSLSAHTIKGRLNALDKHRFYCRPDSQFENKIRILVGGDLNVLSTSEWLETLSMDRINEISENMNDAQRECLTVFCRNLQNGIGLIHGPGGTGKTLMVAALAESAAEPSGYTSEWHQHLYGASRHLLDLRHLQKPQRHAILAPQ